MLGTPSCHLEIGRCGGNLPWLPVEAGVGVHPQEYLCLLEAILDCHLLSIYALLQGVEVFPLLALLASFFLQGHMPVEHLHLLVGCYGLESRRVLRSFVAFVKLAQAVGLGLMD